MWALLFFAPVLMYSLGLSALSSAVSLGLLPVDGRQSLPCILHSPHRTEDASLCILLGAAATPLTTFCLCFLANSLFSPKDKKPLAKVRNLMVAK